MNNEYTIYTDGSSRGNPGPGGWAAIIIEKVKSKTENEERGVREIGGREDQTTNNRMELRAAIEGLKAVPEGSNVTLIADSEYVVKGMTLWIKGWQAKNWRTAAKKPVLNQDLWQELLKAAEGKNIEWKTVLGHSGIEHNERADQIATNFADGKPLIAMG
ncbi:MAG: ribonuclease HI [Patescibacteria group bacterium]|nr:ribonuclease HI [Patescibacteria group bacterium]